MWGNDARYVYRVTVTVRYPAQWRVYGMQVGPGFTRTEIYGPYLTTAPAMGMVARERRQTLNRWRTQLRHNPEVADMPIPVVDYLLERVPLAWEPVTG